MLTLKWGVSARESVVLLYKYFLNHTSTWCLEKDIKKFLKVVLRIFTLMQNIENPTSQKITKWETDHTLALSMQINYQAPTLRHWHYAITSQGKGSIALVQLLFLMFEVHRFVASNKKRKKSQKLKSIFSIFWSYSEFLYVFLDVITKFGD